MAIALRNQRRSVEDRYVTHRRWARQRGPARVPFPIAGPIATIYLNGSIYEIIGRTAGQRRCCDIYVPFEDINKTVTDKPRTKKPYVIAPF